MGDIQNSLKRVVVEKLTSGRFIVTIMFAATACAGFLMDKLEAQAFIGLAGGLFVGYQMKKRKEDGV